MDVISRVALGQNKTLQFNNPNVELVKQVLYVFGNNPFDYWAHIFPKIGPFLKKVMFAIGKFKHIPIKECVNQLYGTVAKRKAERSLTNSNEEEGKASVDFIDLILDVEDNSVTDGIFQKTNMKVSKKLTDEEVVGQCFIFIIAGFDTTANTLGNTAWFLAKNPKIQQKLCEEIDDICGNRDEISYEELGSMRYADVVMKEVLRHYPVAAFAASRECQQPTTIGPGIEIEKDVCVALDLFTLHFDKNIWGEDSDEFKPERFFDLSALQQMSYYPFGGGARLCVGMRLAYLEEKLILIKILQNYYIRECSETEEKLKQTGNVILVPEKVTVVLEKRKH
uniref:Cytochrome P450 n=1 Tax=Panagrolaimus superbus TaxID=310955 RepID=A0A914Z8S3_9BILA